MTHNGSHNSSLVLGLDIGHTQICATLAEIDSRNQINIHSVGTSVTAGMQRGKVADMEQLVKSIRRAVSRAERESHGAALQTIVNVTGQCISAQSCEGVYKSMEASGQISSDDKLKVLKKARLLVQKPQAKILHFLPIHYRVDENVYTRDPVGVFGKLLEVQALAVLCEENHLTEIIQAVQGAGLEVGGIGLNVLATAEVLLTKEERQSGAVLVDFGGGNLQMAYFKEGVLQNCRIVPVGAEQITRDIAYCLKVDLPEAERLKVVFGSASAVGIAESERVEVMAGAEEPREIFRRYLCLIIEARVDELLKKMQQEISEFKIPDTEPPVLVLTGGGVLLKGMSERIRATFPYPCREGLPDNVQPLIETQAYAPSLGLLLYATRHNIIRYQPRTSTHEIEKFMLKARTLIKDMF